MKRLLHAKLLHFLLLGGLLHGVLAIWPQSPDPVRVSSQQVQRLYNGWQRDSGRPPTASEWQASLRRLADEEVLLREALRLKLDETDPVVRQRLLQDWRFANPESAGSDAEDLAAARALGLVEQDEVVRRRLIQRMEQQLASGLQVDEAALDSYIAAHPERYSGLPHLRFRQRWLPEASEAEAQAALSQLRQGLAPSAELFRSWPTGDGTMTLSADQVVQRFGPEFARALPTLAAGGWQGPLHSAYGWHLVQIVEQLPAETVAPASLRQRAAYAWLNQQQDAAIRSRLAALRSRYPVRLPTTATPESAS